MVKLYKTKLKKGGANNNNVSLSNTNINTVIVSKNRGSTIQDPL